MLQNEFETYMKSLGNLNRGQRAALRHAAGMQLRDARRGALEAFYMCLPEQVPEAAENIWFAIGCWRCIWDFETEHELPIENRLRDMCADGTISQSVMRRVDILLDMNLEDDGFLLTHLTQLILLIGRKSANDGIDWSSLLSDLMRWNDADQYVQRKWIRAIYCGTAES